MRQKVFGGSSWRSPQPTPINFLATRNFLEHSPEKFPYEILRHCETKTISTQNRDSPPLLTLNFFDIRIFVKQEGFPHENFRHCATKSFRPKNVNHALSYPQQFLFPEINQKLKASPTKVFGTVRKKFFDRKS